MRPTTAAQWKNEHVRTVTALPTAYHDVIFVNIIKCAQYTRAALISFNKLYVRLLFEGGYYSSKYGMCVCMSTCVYLYLCVCVCVYVCVHCQYLCVCMCMLV